MKTLYSTSILVAAVAMLTFNTPAPASAKMLDSSMKEHRAGHGQMMEMGHMDKMDDMMGMCIKHADTIGLADEQLAKVKPIHTEMQKKQARFKADQRIAEIELKEVMEVKDFDLEKANLAVKKVADIQMAYHLEMIKAMKEVRTILTDDQFNKMKKMMPMKSAEKKSSKRHLKK